MEDKCTKFISLSVSRSGQISGPGVPLSVAARIGEDAERAERNFRYGGPVFRTFRKTMVQWLCNLCSNIRKHFDHHLGYGCFVIFCVSFRLFLHRFCFCNTFSLNGCSFCFTYRTNTFGLLLFCKTVCFRLCFSRFCLTPCCCEAR